MGICEGRSVIVTGGARIIGRDRIGVSTLIDNLDTVIRVHLLGK